MNYELNRYRLNKLVIEILKHELTSADVKSKYGEYRKLKAKMIQGLTESNQTEELVEFMIRCMMFEKKSIERFEDNDNFKERIKEFIGDYIYDCCNLPSDIDKIKDEEIRKSYLDRMGDIRIEVLSVLKEMEGKNHTEGVYVVDIPNIIKRLEEMCKAGGLNV